MSLLQLKTRREEKPKLHESMLVLIFLLLAVSDCDSQRSPHWPYPPEVYNFSPRDRELQRPKYYPLMLAQAGEGGGVLYLSSPCSRAVGVQVFAPWLSPHRPFLSLSLQQGESRNVTLPPALTPPPGSSLSGRGVLVRSSDFIVVHVLNPAPAAQTSASADVMQLRESRDLGREYWVVTYEDPEKPAPAFLGVVALSFETHVTVRLPQEAGLAVELSGRLYGAGETIEVTLAALDALQLQCAGDLSGAFVHASAPVAVFAGSNSTTLAYRNPSSCSDHVQDQMAPLRALGRSFLPPLFPGRTGTDVLKIVATVAETMVEIDEMTSFMLPKAGSKVQFPLFSAFHRIQTSKPVLVAIFARSGRSGSSELGDPAMAVLLPVDRSSDSYAFSVPYVSSASGSTTLPGYTSFYLTVIVEDEHKEGLRLDGQPINGAVWLGDGRTPYVTSSIPVTSDDSLHTVAHASGAPFQAFLFGAGDCAGFATALWPTPNKSTFFDSASDDTSDDGEGLNRVSFCSLTEDGDAASALGTDRCRRFRGQMDTQAVSPLTDLLTLSLAQCLLQCAKQFDCAGVNFPQNTSGPAECHVMLGSTAASEALGWVFFQMKTDQLASGGAGSVSP